MKKVIFIGSSFEGKNQAQQVAAIVEEQGMVPILWTTAFKNGDITFDRIEKISSEVAGAIFLASPDDQTVIRDKAVMAPRANVLFEYGYFTARLTRARVAIVRFRNAELPSDFKGLTYIPAGDWTEHVKLDHHTQIHIKTWLNELPFGNQAHQATSFLHGVSGLWENDTIWTVWRRRSIQAPDFVRFHGKAMLQVSVDGSRGWGFMHGRLEVSVSSCYAEFTVGDSIDSINVDGDGKVLIRSTSIYRNRVILEGNPPQQDGFDEMLRGNRTFEIELKAHENGKLIGEYKNYNLDEPVSLASETLTRWKD